MIKRESFRVAEFLKDGVISRSAIMESGRTVKLEKNESGDEFFCIENPYAVPEPKKGVNSYFKLHFYNRIADAIQAIRDGYADAIQCKTQDIGGFIHVVRFVDEKVGKEYRDKTLSGWKNTKFGYALRAGCKNSWSGYSLIGNKGEKLGWLSNTLKYRTFETEESAMEYGKELLELSRSYAEKIVSAENHEKAIEDVFDEIKKEYGLFSVIDDFMADLITGNGSAYKNEKHELEEYGYDVIQCVIPERENVIENEWHAQASILWAGFKHTFEYIYGEWEANDVKKLIENVFADLYAKNPKMNKLSCKTDVKMDEVALGNLYERWLECVYENRELMYPEAA